MSKLSHCIGIFTCTEGSTLASWRQTKLKINIIITPFHSSLSSLPKACINRHKANFYNEKPARQSCSLRELPIFEESRLPSLTNFLKVWCAVKEEDFETQTNGPVWDQTQSLTTVRSTIENVMTSTVTGIQCVT